jgi:hypothetical protein
MPKAADAVNGDDVARPRARVAKGLKVVTPAHSSGADSTASRSSDTCATAETWAIM